MPTASAVLEHGGHRHLRVLGHRRSSVPSGEVKNPSQHGAACDRSSRWGRRRCCISRSSSSRSASSGSDLAQDRTTPLANAAGAVVGPIGRTHHHRRRRDLDVRLPERERAVRAARAVRYEPRSASCRAHWPRVHPRFHTPYAGHPDLWRHRRVDCACPARSSELRRVRESRGAGRCTSSVRIAALDAAASRRAHRRRAVARRPAARLVPVAACLSIAWLFYETVRRDQFIALIIVLVVIIRALWPARAGAQRERRLERMASSVILCSRQSGCRWRIACGAGERRRSGFLRSRR